MPNVTYIVAQRIKLKEIVDSQRRPTYFTPEV